MASRRSRVNRAAALHRQAAAAVLATASALATFVPRSMPAADQLRQRELAERLRALAPKLAPGWLGTTLNPMPAASPTGGRYRPTFVRIGTAQPLDDATFPVIVPLLGSGHLAFDADVRDPRVAGALRALLLRLLAATPPGTLLVRGVDAAGERTTFAPFAPLAGPGLLPPAAADLAGLRAVLAEAEQWVRAARPGGPGPARPERPGRTLLIVIASLPELTDTAELARITALAQAGPAAGVHLVVAGWPPPPLAGPTATGPLPLATQVWVRNPGVLIGNPPGVSFRSPARPGWPGAAGRAPAGAPAPGTAAGDAGLNCPVFLDEEPPAMVVADVCREIAEQAEAQIRLRLTDLLPAAEQRADSGADAGAGLTVGVGMAGEAPLVLRFNDLTPHWLLGGRPGAGKTTFLTNVVYGLAARYAPDQLSLYLIDCTDEENTGPGRAGLSFTEFISTGADAAWLPQARLVGVAADREFGLSVLRQLAEEVRRRELAAQRLGASGFAELRDRCAEQQRLTRLLCVLDEFQVLLAGTDRITAEAVGLLEALSRAGRGLGVHLLLAGRGSRGVEALRTGREPLFGQFPVRVALPGGADVLEPKNESAAGLPLGTAVVNTAGGLGGPRGATRGHEKVIRFPDPHGDRGALSALRGRLWQERPGWARPPTVFVGYARQRLVDDPGFQRLAPPAGDRPDERLLLLGRVVDAQLSSATFTLDGAPGRHLAVLGPSDTGAELVAAAGRGLAAQHPPGSARFVLAPLVGAGAAVAARLAAELSGAGHTVHTVDAAGLAGALAPDRPGYLLAFGLDSAADLPGERLRRLLAEGPANGAHLIGWWRGLGRFREQTAEPTGPTGITGVVLLNVPATDEMSHLIGAPVEWRYRPNRALLFDRRTGHGTLFVPFTDAGGASP